jgi:hypothetical protein
MNNIVQFRPRKTDRVVIWRGIIAKSSFAAEIGQCRYFVDLIEADGGEIGLSACSSYHEALIEAREIALDWGGVPVLDLVDQVPH